MNLKMKSDQRHNRRSRKDDAGKQNGNSRWRFIKGPYRAILESLTEVFPQILPDISVGSSTEEKLMVLIEVYPAIDRFRIIQSVLHIGILTKEDHELIDSCFQYLVDAHYSSNK